MPQRVNSVWLGHPHDPVLDHWFKQCFLPNSDQARHAPHTFAWIVKTTGTHYTTLHILNGFQSVENIIERHCLNLSGKLQLLSYHFCLYGCLFFLNGNLPVIYPLNQFCINTIGLANAYPSVNYAMLGSVNGFPPDGHQAIIRTDVNFMSIAGTNWI